MTTLSSEAERLADSIKESGQFTPLAELDQAAALLRRIPELEAELEATKLGESFHDKQANEYARQVAHWIGKFDEVKAERDQLRAELEGRWLPIESATEEGKSVLVMRDGDIYPSAAYQSNKRWYWSSNGGWAGYPSHWQPLPPPPTTQEGDK